MKLRLLMKIPLIEIILESKVTINGISAKSLVLGAFAEV